ncbi:hypothetical protein F4823DRAFT_630380 [Ustulina deusta]|nr:hypothetical protein F4823DRAFT_630380 [Ustulina deusta]
MPPFTTSPPLLSLIGRDTIVNASNTTIAEPVAQVICAWPVSGQYGFGTRILYYVFVATCVLARRTEWLRNACLAAALLLPAVAAVHAVVLAVVQVTAVDMDIYGAFQICSIGILAAPITVYNSRTYFNDPGRNIIFLWTGLLLAGMLSLAVEFFRTEPHDCPFDGMGAPFNLAASCSRNCSDGPSVPFSPIRKDPTNQPAIIPVPQRLSFSAVTLLAAASSIPPVLTLIFTWEKILEINWKRRFAREEVKSNDPIEGTNGATPKMITFINGAIRNFLSTIQIPVFTGIVVVLLVIGELNFWSTQVSYQTEPFSSIGQWSNVVATVLVVLGSLFYVRKQPGVSEKEDLGSNHPGSRSPRARPSTQSDRDQESIHSGSPGIGSRINTAHPMDDCSIHRDLTMDAQSDKQRGEASELETVTTNTTDGPVPLSISNKHRKKVATMLNQVGEYLGTPSPDRYDNSVFQEGKAEFPEIPGEAGRVAGFEDLRDRYRSSRQHVDDESIIPGLIPRVNSSSSIRISADRNPSPSRPPRSPSRSSTTPAEQNEYSPLEISRITTSPVAGSARRARRDTLEVPRRPRPVHIHPRNSSSSSTKSPAMILNTEGSPKIVVSGEPEETWPTAPTENPSPLGLP